MDTSKLQTLKGFRDFLPGEAEKRQNAVDIIKKTFELYGFEPLETPALEYQEVLLGKYGEEADKLVYKFKDLGGRDVALRYDQTVPTARVLAQYYNRLPMPWRRYQIQPVWRAEKPQRGRYREFLQCDADIFGSSSVLADAEIIALSASVIKNLGFKNFKIYINDRNILYELMDYANIAKDLQLSVISTIDKLDRRTKEETAAELIDKGLTQKVIAHLFGHIEAAKPTQNITALIRHVESLGVEKDKLLFQARLARGLDYYTSTIFELKIDEYKAGSVAGGGRYDNLIKQLSGISIPAVGIAFGIDRLVEAMQEQKLFPEERLKPSVLVTIFNPELTKMSAAVTEHLRKNGVIAELYPDENTRLDKQLKYADKKGIEWLIVIGPDEVKKDTTVLKNLKTGRQEDVPLKQLVEKIAKGA